jgi:hypothetical protein
MGSEQKTMFSNNTVVWVLRDKPISKQLLKFRRKGQWIGLGSSQGIWREAHRIKTCCKGLPTGLWWTGCEEGERWRVKLGFWICSSVDEDASIVGSVLVRPFTAVTNTWENNLKSRKDSFWLTVLGVSAYRCLFLFLWACEPEHHGG